MSLLYRVARPLLFTIPAEKAHNITLAFMKSGLTPHTKYQPPASLRLRVWDRSFSNPLGLAAGFDKNAEVINPALKLGFGFTEIGTVTPLPQPGNSRPRVFRCSSAQAIINKMGFPNEGLRVFQHNLTRFLEEKPRPAGHIGVNIGMNKNSSSAEKDYIRLIRALAPMADYLTVNISSPNTPGLRNYQSPETFEPFIDQLITQRDKTCQINPPPLLIKLSPDLTQKDQETLARLALKMNLDGLILTNTTLARQGALPDKFAGKQGGLSGQPLKSRANKVLRNFYTLTGGKIPLIGVGGISNALDAYERIKSGASLVQLYSALVYNGPGLVTTILEGLEAHLKEDGFQNIQDAVGTDTK